MFCLQVLKNHPRNGFAMVHLGFIIKTHDNNPAKAIPYLRDGIATGENGVLDARFYFHLGDAYQRVGQNKQVRNAFRFLFLSFPIFLFFLIFLFVSLSFFFVFVLSLVFVSLSCVCFSVSLSFVCLFLSLKINLDILICNFIFNCKQLLCNTFNNDQITNLNIFNI